MLAPYFAWNRRVDTMSARPRRSNSGRLAGNSDSPMWKRGNRSRSATTTANPCRARSAAATAPPGPPPTTRTSQACMLIHDRGFRFPGGLFRILLARLAGSLAGPAVPDRVLIRILLARLASGCASHYHLARRAGGRETFLRVEAPHDRRHEVDALAREGPLKARGGEEQRRHDR